VSYHLPYSGRAMIDPRPIYPLEHFVAILPRSIRFVPAQSGIYADKQPPDQPEAIAEVATNTRPGEKLGFEVSGEGVLRERNQNASNQRAGQPATEDRRPGGGLGPPTEGRDPLEQYRWWILGGFGMVLAAGALYTTRGAAPSRPRAQKSGSESRSDLLLNALKEELFQLEMEHKQGQISDLEYQKAKAALDQTLARAVQRHRRTP
jgi:hypothetical protein